MSNTQKEFTIMKYTALFNSRTLMALTLGVLLIGTTACKDDDTPDEGPVTEPVTVEPTFTATVKSVENGLNPDWSPVYNVGVYMIGHGETFAAQNVVEGCDNVAYTVSTDGILTPKEPDRKIAMPAEGSFDFVAYYPWKQGAESDDEDRINGDLYPVDLSQQDYLPGIDLLWCRASKGYTAAQPAVALEFSHVLAQLRLQIVKGAGISESDLDGISLMIKNVYRTAYFSLRDGTLTYTGQPGDLLLEGASTDNTFTTIMLPSTEVPQSDRQATIVVPALSKSFTWDIPADYELVAGKCTVSRIEVDRDGIRVLSNEIVDWTGGEGLPDYEGDFSAGLALPNSYIVRPDQTVEIPVAKAYAVWNTNTLLQSSGISIPKELKPMIVWQDYYYEAPNYNDKTMIVSNEELRLVGSGEEAKIVVTVPAEKQTGGQTLPLKGNIVVGLSDMSGKFYWSWHLWVVDYDPAQPENQYVSNGVTFMSRNLGDLTGGAVDGYSAPCLYQWGRKDPLAGNNWSEYPWMAGYVYDGVGKTSTSSMPSTCSTDATANMVSSIQSPLKGLKDVYGAPNYRYTYDWLSDVPGLASDRWCNEDGTKSPFDPCPEGWRVPVSGIDAQSPWNDVTMSSWEHGLRTDNAYYQAVGYFSGSMMADYDSHGYYWSATMDPSTGQAYGFDFTQTAIKPSALIRAYYACPVRCVKE